MGDVMLDKLANKKILVEFLGKNGAGTVFTLEIVNSLKNNGMDVWVILSDCILNRDKWEEINDSRIHVKFIHTGNKKTIINATLSFLINRNKLFDDIKNITFDYALRTFPHPWMEFIERKLNINRVFYILHDPIPHTGTELFRKIISKRNVHTSDDIIVLSRKFMKVVSEIYKVPPANIHYMRHGLLSVQESNEVSEVQREQLEKFDIVFVFFGRIDEYKGLHILSAAYKKVKNQTDYSIALVVAGSGDFADYKDEYNQLEDVFIYNKYINDKEIIDIFTLNNAVIVLPYLDATQSGVTAIAAEFVRPIIASDSGALREQLMGGNVGIFCTPGDSDDLAESMNRFITDSNMFEQEIEKMRIFKNYLGWDAIINEFFSNLR